MFHVEVVWLYNTDTPEYKVFLNSFLRDNRNNRMLMVSVTPYVHAMDVNLFSVGRDILQSARSLSDCVAKPRVLVVHGGGIHLLHEGQEAKKMYRMRRGKKQKMSLSHAIDFCHEKLCGSATPIIIVGYNCVGRCVSVRGTFRVLTHIIACLGKGRTTAELEQLVMRAGGRNREILTKKGFPYVTVLLLEEDLMAVKQLPEFTELVLEKVGTGHVEDLDWTNSEYPVEFKDLVNHARKHCKKGVNVDDRMRGEITYTEPVPTTPRRQEEMPAMDRGSEVYNLKVDDGVKIRNMHMYEVVFIEVGRRFLVQHNRFPTAEDRISRQFVIGAAEGLQYVNKHKQIQTSRHSNDAILYAFRHVHGWVTPGNGFTEKGIRILHAMLPDGAESSLSDRIVQLRP